MSVTIRLARFGKKHAPAYKIVASVTRDKRNGKFLEVIGHYNPSENPVKFEYNKEKLETLVKNGAIVSKAVEDLINKKYKYVKYNPNAKDEVVEAQVEEKSTEKSKEEVEEKAEPTPEA